VKGIRLQVIIVLSQRSSWPQI